MLNQFRLWRVFPTHPVCFVSEFLAIRDIHVIRGFKFRIRVDPIRRTEVMVKNEKQTLPEIPKAVSGALPKTSGRDEIGHWPQAGSRVHQFHQRSPSESSSNSITRFVITVLTESRSEDILRQLKGALTPLDSLTINMPPLRGWNSIHA